MNERIKSLKNEAWDYACGKFPSEALGLKNHEDYFAEKFAELIIEETLTQVDEQCYGRGENQWYYNDDKRWIRLHFGYGELKK